MTVVPEVALVLAVIVPVVAVTNFNSMVAKKQNVKLKAGEKAPAFNLLNQDGNKVNLADFKGYKVYVYFYPRANTSGCTVQAKALSEAKNKLEKLNVKVVGISPDLPEKLLKFDEKHNLGFILLSDPDKKIAEKYGVVGEKMMFGKKITGIIRSGFLLDEKGKILHVWYKISPKKTVEELLKVL